MINLNELQQECKIWVDKNFPDAKPYQALLGTFEEVGELAHNHLKMEQGIRNITMDDIKDSIGDIVIFLIDYCNKHNLNFEECIELAWNTASKRDWQKHSENGINK